MAKRLWVLGSMVAAVLLLWGCGSAAPAPTPTKPAAEPTKAAAPAQATSAPAKAAEPTKPAATQAAAPAKIDYPTKGRAIQILVPYTPGGNVDLSARLIAPALEKGLGTSVEIINKAGAASQTASTDLAKSKPDGYTFMVTSLTALLSTYLDAEKQAVYHRKDFAPVAGIHWTPVGIAVKSDGPYKNVTELIEAAKAKPDSVKAGTSGLLGTPHMAIVLLDAASGSRFAPVHFEGGPQATTAVLGGHIDSQFEGSSAFVSAYKGGNLKVLGLFDDKPSKTFPDAELLPAKGYKILMGLSLCLVAPAGTPKEIVDKVSAAVKEGTLQQDFITKSGDLGFDVRYYNPQEYDAQWTEFEKGVAAVIKQVRGSVREK